MARNRLSTRSGACDTRVEPDDPGLPVVGQGALAAVRKSKRSAWRAGVLISVHVLVALHVTHSLIAHRTLSPLEPSETMYTLELGYVNCGFLFFAVTLLGTMVFGRFFCGWGCHIVALQDFCAWIMKRLGVRPKPLRSRLLALAPLAVALYMFVWPTLVRIVSDGPGRRFPGFSNHLMTASLWATFPGPVFAVLTFLTCGFAAVYVLGAKGFCTYGCPYGAFFGGLDRAAPGRIVVNDDCEQCGHCTATCTSNVRVHDEVRLYGMVVDPGCMKCMDCVSVCPKGALSFSFARPSLLKKSRGGTRARSQGLRLSEEIVLGVTGLAATLAFRGLYDGPPLLMSVGLGGITAFLALKLWQLVRRPGVSVQNLELKAGGRLTRPGRAFMCVSVLWMAFTAHSGFVQWHRARGRHYLEQTEVSRADGLSGAFRSTNLSSRHRHAVQEAFRHFSLADGWGFAGVVEVKLGLAWCYVLRGDLADAAREARAAAALAPDRPELRQNLLDIERAASPSPEDRFRRAEGLVAAGKLEEAASVFAACVADAPDSFPARFDYGGVLRRLGRNDEAIAQLREARRLSPGDPDVHVELGLAYMATGADDDAIASFQRAIALDPQSPESRLHLPGLIEKLEESRRAGGGG